MITLSPARPLSPGSSLGLPGTIQETQLNLNFRETMSISALESGNISQNTVLSSLESFALSALLHPQRPDAFKQFFFFNLALPVVVYWKH